MQFRLYIADHFDLLATGKHLAVGLYPDLVLVLNHPPEVAPPSPEVPFGVDVGMLMNISGLPSGQHEGEVRVQPPGFEDRPVVAARFTCEVKEHENAVNVTLRFHPLLMPVVGMYTVRVQIGGEDLRAQFEVRARVDSAAMMPQAVHQPVSEPVLEAPAKPRRQRRSLKSDA